VKGLDAWLTGGGDPLPLEVDSDDWGPRTYGAHPMQDAALCCSWCGCQVADLQAHEATDCRGGASQPVTLTVQQVSPWRLASATVLVWMLTLALIAGLLVVLFP